MFEWPALQDLPLIGLLLRGPLADVQTLRRQMLLPETTDELCAVARRLGAPMNDLRLGKHMPVATCAPAASSNDWCWRPHHLTSTCHQSN
jgi:hypothetical protein